jgi:thiamine biosynthesis lipoprotein
VPRDRVRVRLPRPGSATEDRLFGALGTTVRVVVIAPDAVARADRVEDLLRDYDRRLSRFRADSELSALNAARTDVVRASPLLLDAVAAAMWAVARSGGLVDPTLLPELERAGYTESRTPTGGRVAGGVPLPEGPGTPAAPHPGRRWRQIGVLREAGVVHRPAGLRLDLGGSGKGHVADLAAAELEGAERWVVDCGGDLRVGCTAPQEVHVAHPLENAIAARLTLTAGAVATSAIHARAWLAADGTPRHHIIDPATGEPAWTGIVASTALAPSVLEAETLAKTALLSGPETARRLLAMRGGLIVSRDGEVERIGLG